MLLKNERRCHAQVGVWHLAVISLPFSMSAFGGKAEIDWIV